MDKQKRTPFDFEHMADLAENAPHDFEAIRRRMINEIIDSAPEPTRRRLIGLQWQIDVVRDKAPNPMSACIEISRMMWDRVSGDDGLLEHMNRLTTSNATELAADAAMPRPEAEVIHLTPRSDDYGDF